jgi:hypothetical protein
VSALSHRVAKEDPLHAAVHDDAAADALVAHTRQCAR